LDAPQSEALANNPEMLRGFGLVGNLAADKMDDREKKKRKEASLLPKIKRPCLLPKKNTQYGYEEGWRS
jgi:hypothetical protein